MDGWMDGWMDGIHLFFDIIFTVMEMDGSLVSSNHFENLSRFGNHHPSETTNQQMVV